MGGLRGKAKAAATRGTMAFRVSPELRYWVERQASTSGRTASRVIVDALELDRALAEGLDGDWAHALAAWAADHRLSLGEQLGEVVAGLVRAGLAAEQSDPRE